MCWFYRHMALRHHTSHQPVSMGSPRFHTMDTGAFRITQAWFPPGAALEPHTHDRAILAVMLDGSFTTRIGARQFECVASTAWTEPCEERHANYVGALGARVVATQPNLARKDLIEPFARMLDEPHCERDPIMAVDAHRVAVELMDGDSLTPLVLDSLIVLMMARAARLTDPRSLHKRPQSWLGRARELVHARFREPLGLTGIAAEVGVTPWHLARQFRRQFNASIGEYARSLRINWALEQLAHSQAPISIVALQAGFADQSHLTRACKTATGLPPAAYRLRLQSAR
jgi:AraC-like DNA-binding protein/quercetin dioxygenase-like cupin family protein